MKPAFVALLAIGLLIPAQAAARGVSVRPHRVDFGRLDQSSGDSALRTITLTNNTGRSQQLVDDRVSDLNHFGAFRGAESTCYDFEGPATPLPAGGSCTFSLAMSLVDPGRFTATFQSFWLDADNNPTDSPIVRLRGTVLP